MKNAVVRKFKDFDSFLYACEKYRPKYLAPPEVKLYKNGGNYYPLVVITVPVRFEGETEVWKVKEHFYDVYMNTFFLNKLKRFLSREEAEKVREDLVRFQKLYNEKYLPAEEKEKKLRDEYLSIPHYEHEKAMEVEEKMEEAEREVNEILKELFEIARPYLEMVLRDRGIYYGTSRDIPGSEVYY